MAEVFEAEITGPAGFAKTVCLKRIRPELSINDEFVEMFETEARIAAMLHHTNIVSVSDFDKHAGQLFLAMEYVDGCDLKQVISEIHRTGLELPAAFAIYVMDRLLAALDHAHTRSLDGRAQPVIHRDVSPHNILLSVEGAVKLTDFGIAKSKGVSGATQVGVIKGKIAYLAPEQMTGTVSPLSDLFSAGLVMYEMLTGERFFNNDNVAPAVQLRNLSAAPIPWLSENLNAYLAALLAPDPKDRFQSAAAARTALKALDIAPVVEKTAANLVTSAMRLKQLRIEQENAAQRGGNRVSMLETRPAAGSRDPQPSAAGLSGEPSAADFNRAASKRRKPPHKQTIVFVGVSALIAASVGLGILFRKSSGETPTAAPSSIQNAAFVTSAQATLPAAPPKLSTAQAEPPAVAIPVGTTTRGEAPSKIVRLANPEAAVVKVPPSESAVRADRPPDEVASGKPGYLDVNVKPWASVSVDGDAKGTTPIQALPLRPGRHMVRLENKPLGFDEEIRIQVRSGKPLVIKREIEKIKP